jgi:hypothetical protein
MSYDFPASPSPGDEYTPPVGGQTYIWQPPRWLVKGIPPAGGGGGGGVPEAPTDGQQYGRTNAAWSVVTPNPTWSTLTGKPATFPPTLPILESDVTNLVTDLGNKEPKITVGTTSQYWRGDKSFQTLDKAAVGLNNVDNTSDVSKPVSTATQNALNLKLDSASYTAADVLTKIKTVDGSASGLDADVLDGQDGAYYLAWANFTGKPSTFPPTLPIPSSGVTGLDAAQTTQDNRLTAVETTNTSQDTAISNNTTAIAGKEPAIASGNPAYFWAGDKTWKPVAGGASLTISDTPPGSPSAGSLWWESDSGNLFLYYNDGDSSQFVQINVPNVSGLATSNAKNRIVNGGMQHSQELGSGPFSTAGYVLDQWSNVFSGITVSAGRGGIAPSPDNSQWAIQLSVGTAKPSLAAGDYWFISQPIEGIRVADFQFGTASAKRAILRFNFYAGVAGTYGMSLQNGGTTRSWCSNFTAPAGWSRQTFVIPGDTTGTWPKDNTKAMIVNVGLALGTTYLAPAVGWNAGNFFGVTGMSNGAASVTSHWLADVGLYLDDGSGIPPRWEMPDEAQELIACQRYWRTLYISVDGYETGGNPLIQNVQLAPVMRVAPTFSIGGALSTSNVGALSANSISSSALYLQASTVATGRGYYYSGTPLSVLNARM